MLHISGVDYTSIWRITTEEYDKKRVEWTRSKQKYEDQLERINHADEEYYVTASSLLELASRSYELFMGSEPEQKRQIITLTLQNLEIKDGKLSYEWVKPFDSVFVSAKGHTWGSLLDTFRTKFPQFDISIEQFKVFFENFGIQPLII